MVLGIIHKANSYSAEVQFVNIVIEQEAHFAQAGREVRVIS